MTKFLIIFLLVALLIFIGVSVVFKFIKRLFSPFMPEDSQKSAKSRDKDEEILYRKDDVVVMRGEAKKDDKSGEDR